MQTKTLSQRIDTAIRQKSIVLFFILPTVITLALLLLYPFFYGIYISFFKTNLINKWTFVGMRNYVDIFHDPELLKSAWLTVQFTVSVVLGHFVIGVFLALVLNRPLKGRAVFRALLLLPWLFPEVVIANLWKWIFHSATGLVNGFLQGLGIISEPMSWLGSPQWALAIIILTCIWKGYPLIMIQILGGLQSISADLYEAATIDGAGRWQSFRYVTIPGLRSTLVVTLILDTVWWFKHVTIIWVMTQGGPGTATNTISIDIYKRAFEYFNFGSSAAIAVVVFLVCVAISLVYRRLLRDNEQ